MKPIAFIFLSFVIALSFSSCENDDSDLGLVSDEVNDTIDFDGTPLIERDSVRAYDNDYYENSRFTRVVDIVYNGSSATVKSDYSDVVSVIDGAHVTVRSSLKGLHYIIGGTTENGSLKIYGENKFLLTLNGVDIYNPHGAAINNQCGKSMYIDIAGTNSLKDGNSYQTPSNEDEKGTLFSEGQMIFSGNGTLNVDGNYLNAIASDDYIVFRPGNIINVSCNKRSCIKANDGLSIRGGALNINAFGVESKGINSDAKIDVAGGRTIIKANDKGIDANSGAKFSGGETYIYSSKAVPANFGNGLILENKLRALFSPSHKLLQIK